MNQRLTDAVDLQMQMKQAPWNVKGPSFIGLHELFDKVDEAVESYVDMIAEISRGTDKWLWFVEAHSQATKPHFAQAKRELTGVPDLDLKEAILESAPESERWDPATRLAGPGYSLPIQCTLARALEPTSTILFYGTRLREKCEQDYELGYQITKRIAEVATQSLGGTQGRLMQYTDKNIPEQPVSLSEQSGASEDHRLNPRSQ